MSRFPGSIPNLLSLARLVLAPVCVALVLGEEFAAAFWVVVVAGLSDAVDGTIARWFRARSWIGAMLDPIADKALLVGTVIALAAVDALPVWLAALVVLRDAAILVGAAYLFLHGVAGRYLEPTWAGKASTLLQIVLVVTILAMLAFAWPIEEAVAGLIWATGAAALISGAGYAWRGRCQLKARRPRP